MRRAQPPRETRASRVDPTTRHPRDKEPVRADALLTLAGYVTACPEARARIRADHAAGLAVAADLQQHLAIVAAAEAEAAWARAAAEIDDEIAALPSIDTPRF